MELLYVWFEPLPKMESYVYLSKISFWFCTDIICKMWNYEQISSPYSSKILHFLRSFFSFKKIE